VHIILGFSFVCLWRKKTNFSHGKISMFAVIIQEAIIHEKRKSFPHPRLVFYTLYTSNFVLDEKITSEGVNDKGRETLIKIEAKTV
jgi:hypothetical protein